MTPETIKDISNIFLLLSAVCSVGFTLAYGIRSRWSNSIAGRGLMYQTVALSMVLTYGAIANYDPGQFPGERYVRLVMFMVIFTALANTLRTLLKVQNQRVKTEAETSQAAVPTPLKDGE